MAFDFNDLQYLSTPLPANVQKFKMRGDLDRAAESIRIYLEKDIPYALRARLNMELEILKRLPLDYSHNFEQAVARCQANISDFTAEELTKLQDNNDVEWIFINGEVYFLNRFMENLINCYPEYAARCTNPEKLDNPERKKMLNEQIAKMKENGKAGYHYKMRVSLKTNPEKARVGTPVKVHLLLPLEYAQIKNVNILSYSDAEKVTVADSEVMQRTICFEETLKEADKEYFVEFEFDNISKYVNPDPEKVSLAQPKFYTDEVLPHIQFTPYIQALTKEIIGDETNPLKKARMIYDYVTSHVNYSFMPNYFTNPNLVEYIAVGGKGDCGIQALMFITLCRCAGVPARWQSGVYTHPLNAGSHDWAQYYVAPYGWLYADPSFGTSSYRAGNFERRDFYAYNLEPFRLPSCQEFQQQYYPVPKDHMRRDPYDTQGGEIEYIDRAFEPDEYDYDCEILESYPIDC